MAQSSRPRPLLFGSCLMLAALVVSGVSSCLQTGAERRAALRRAAEGILPPQARIRAFGFGDCVELASSPSCARVVFELPKRSSALRVKAVRVTAVRNGWKVTESDNAQGGWSLFLRRPGFTAYVVLWRPDVYRLRCNGARPPDQCFNTLNLERSS
jgi:hypothetical protein